MSRGIVTVLAVALLAAALWSVMAVGQGQAPLAPTFERLDDGRLRVGPILVDQARGALVVPGEIIRHASPLEYLAVTRGGIKAYESLLELDANAYEFNLACILLGLDAARARLPRYQFDTEPVTGQRVSLSVSWDAPEGRRSVNAVDMLYNAGQQGVSDRWIYTGAATSPDGRYQAHEFGTLVGFVHDPAAIIEHAEGLGIGNYGAVGANAANVPPVGTRVELQLRTTAP